MPAIVDAAFVAGITPEMVVENMALAVAQMDPVRTFVAEFARPGVVCDIDGTLAERDLATCLVVNAVFATDYHYDDIVGPGAEDWIDDPDILKWVEDHRHDPQFLSNLDPYQDAIWGLWSLRSGGYHVTIASDRDASLTATSTAWLARWGVQYDAVDIGDDRKLALAEAATPDAPLAFIDDNPKRADDLPKPGVTVYLLDRPWNQEVKESDRVVRIQTWAELLSKFPALGGLAPRTDVLTTASVGAATLTKEFDEADHPRDEHGQFESTGGKPTGGKPGKLPTPKSGDHVRVRQWSDGKWRLQHLSANQKVTDKVFNTRTEAIQHAHAQGWSARYGTNVVHPGQAIPPEPAPKPGTGSKPGGALPPTPPVAGATSSYNQMADAWAKEFPSAGLPFSDYHNAWINGANLPTGHPIAPSSSAAQFFQSHGLQPGGAGKPTAGVAAGQALPSTKPPAGMLISALPKQPDGDKYIQYAYQSGVLSNQERNTLLASWANNQQQMQSEWNQKFPGHPMASFAQSYTNGGIPVPGLESGIKQDSPAGKFFANHGVQWGQTASIAPTGIPPLSAAEKPQTPDPLSQAVLTAPKPGSAGGPFVQPNAPLTPAPVQYSPKPAEVKYQTQLKFNVATGAGARVRSTSSASQAQMTSTAKQAISAYTGSWYDHINTALRGGVFSKDDEARIEHMDAALGQASSTENVIVGRSVDSKVLGKIGQCQIGGKFVDHGYVSTSLYPTGDTGGGKPLTIEVPKGSPGLFLMGTGLTSYGEGEAEFLLPRESRFEVLSSSSGNFRLRYLGTTGAVKASQPDVAGSLTEVKVPISGPANNPAFNNPAVKDVQTVVGGATKIDGPHGSQPGDWYKTKSGDTVYAKPMSLERAQNEVATTAAYQVLGKATPGVDVPATSIAQDKATGQAYVVSPKIEGLKTLTGDQWKSGLNRVPAEKAQGLWAMDVLLSNRDAVGMAHDNLAVNPAGGVSRIDQGAGMAFRAQGSAKPEWKVGGAWSEPYTMRGMAGGGVSGNEQAKNVFGQMTNQQAADALGKLYTQTTHADLQMLRQAWNDMGIPKPTIDSNIAVVVDRLNRIPSIQAELLKNPGAKAAV